MLKYTTAAIKSDIKSNQHITRHYVKSKSHAMRSGILVLALKKKKPAVELLILRMISAHETMRKFNDFVTGKATETMMSPPGQG